MAVKPIKYHPPEEIRNPKKRALLVALSCCGFLGRACQAAGVHHSSFYVWRREDGAFAAASREAKACYIEYLEAVADERATKGKRPSDTLLIFRLKALKPEMYRERHETRVTPANDYTVPVSDEEIKEEANRTVAWLKAQAAAMPCPKCGGKRDGEHGSATPLAAGTGIGNGQTHLQTTRTNSTP